LNSYFSLQKERSIHLLESKRSHEPLLAGLGVLDRVKLGVLSPSAT
jgi:hypothetical protein